MEGAGSTSTIGGREKGIELLLRKAKVKSLGKCSQGRKVNTEIDFEQKGGVKIRDGPSSG
jgi:hypothetical protein